MPAMSPFFTSAILAAPQAVDDVALPGASSARAAAPRARSQASARVRMLWLIFSPSLGSGKRRVAATRRFPEPKDGENMSHSIRTLALAWLLALGAAARADDAPGNATSSTACGAAKIADVKKGDIAGMCCYRGQI